MSDPEEHNFDLEGDPLSDADWFTPEEARLFADDLARYCPGHVQLILALREETDSINGLN